MMFMAGANSIFSAAKLLTTPNKEEDEDTKRFEALARSRRSRSNAFASTPKLKLTPNRMSRLLRTLLRRRSRRRTLRTRRLKSSKTKHGFHRPKARTQRTCYSGLAPTMVNEAPSDSTVSWRMRCTFQTLF